MDYLKELGIDRDSLSIRERVDKSKELLMATLQLNGFLIGNIMPQRKEFQLLAVNQHPDSIKCIENPDVEVQLAAIRRCCFSIQHIKNPAVEVQLETVREDGYTIQYIENPNYEVQLAAVKQNVIVVSYIKNRCSQVVEYVDNYFGKKTFLIHRWCGGWVTNDTLMVKEDPFMIRYMKNPDRNVQLAAVETDVRSVYCIKDPHPDVFKYLENKVD